MPQRGEQPSEKERRDANDERGGFDRVSNVAMHALARRGMSSAELRTYLIGREFPVEEVDVEIERLESVGLLDDLQLAETLVRTLRERKGLGRSALKSELGRRRLDPDAIGAALETLEGDENSVALELAMKRAGQLRSYDRETAHRRLMGFLQRKGYFGRRRREGGRPGPSQGRRCSVRVSLGLGS